MYSFINGRSPRSKTQMYNIPMHHPFANYCTEALQKSDMKFDYENEIFLNNLHLIPDPLMKNLADTLITSEKPEKPQKQCLNEPKMTKPDEVRPDSTLAGITSFFSGVFNMLSGAVFRRTSVDYYDCFDDGRQGSPSNWRRANDDQDKNGQPKFSCDGPNLNAVPDMNNHEVSSCKQKLDQVRSLLSKPATNKQPNNWRKRPKKVFVEPGLIEDSFEDAFSPEDFISLSNNRHMEYHSPLQYQNQELCETEGPKTKINIAPIETTEIDNGVTNETTTQKNTCDKEADTMKISNVTNKNKENTDTKPDNVTSKNNNESIDEKHQLVSSCEDKLSKLKALLRDKRSKNTQIMTPTPEPITEQPRSKTIPISKPVDKHYKNPHRLLDKRYKMKMKCSIQDDVIFASEVDLDSPADSPSTPSTINSSDTSLGDYFDEMKGRFRTNSTTESEDSFQIVFNDSPKVCRASDCESEDSFIVFEDTDCYTSNDVFGESDSDSEVSDSGCSTMTCKLSHSLSRTVSNLTDDTLYESSDEVDCARVNPVGAKGLLIDSEKKRLKKEQPAKKICPYRTSKAAHVEPVEPRVYMYAAAKNKMAEQTSEHQAKSIGSYQR